MKKTIRRAYNRFYSQMIVRKMEREFTASDGKTTLRFMFFEEPKSDVLIVGFASRDDRGPVYHYVHTLSGLNANRLYIKDDYAKHGTFYLGHTEDFDIENAVFELINRTKDIIHAKKLFFIGSSKGGYAAINFGIEYPDSEMVVAAPSYHVGEIFRDRKGYVEASKLLFGGPIPTEQVKEYDERLEKKIASDLYATTQRLFIHYSDQEPYFREHVKDLLDAMRRAGIRIEENVEAYTAHEDLKLYYPDYARAVVRMRIVSHAQSEKEADDV